MASGASGREKRVARGLKELMKPLTPTEEQLAQIASAMQTKILAAVQEAESTGFKIQSPNDAYKLTCAMAALLKTMVELDRWKAERGAYLQDAAEQLMETWSHRLQTRDPELLERIHQSVREAEEASMRLDVGTVQEDTDE